MDYQNLTQANERTVQAAERIGAPSVDGFPLRLNLELTAACNIHCPMCQCEIHRQRHRRLGVRDFHMPVETFRAIARAAFPRVSIVNPTMVGEPLMLPYLDELIEQAGRYSVRIDIMTNGTLLTPELSARLLPHLAGLAISFDGATKATFEKIRAGASFATVLANLAAFARLRREMGLARRVPLSFSVALMRENIAELPALIELAAKHHVDTIVASHMVVFRPELEASSLVHEPRLAADSLARATELARSFGVEPRFPAPLPSAVRPAATLLEQDGVGLADFPQKCAPPEPNRISADQAGPPAPTSGSEPVTAITCGRPERWQGKVYCKFPWRETFISIGGDVAPCCAQGRPLFGNAFSEDFLAIWNGPHYQALRRGLFLGDPPDFCKQCTFLQEAGYSQLEGERYLRVRALE